LTKTPIFDWGFQLLQSTQYGKYFIKNYAKVSYTLPNRTRYTFVTISYYGTHVCAKSMGIFNSLVFFGYSLRVIRHPSFTVR
jgi:hypothetical protein